MADRLVRAIANDASIKISAVYTRDLTEKARQTHKTLPVATAALGRTLAAVSIMGAELKADNGSITVQVKGKGPLGSIVAVSDSKGNVRGYVQNPFTNIPLRKDGKLDVGTAVGKGYLSVLKDVGMKEPVNGTVALVNGEIAEDITRYFAESEQVPSAVALGVLIDLDQSVKQAGGYIVQVMPGTDDETITKLEENIKKTGPVTTLLESGYSLEDIIKKVLDGMDVKFLQEDIIEYKCNCSKERVSKAIISLGKAEIEKMIAEQDSIEVTCQFCDNKYSFTSDKLSDMLTKALTK